MFLPRPSLLSFSLLPPSPPDRATLVFLTPPPAAWFSAVNSADPKVALARVDSPTDGSAKPAFIHKMFKFSDTKFFIIHAPTRTQ